MKIQKQKQIKTRCESKNIYFVKERIEITKESNLAVQTAKFWNNPREFGIDARKEPQILIYFGGSEISEQLGMKDYLKRKQI